MSELFPPIHENNHFYLEVDSSHEIYVEECGNKDGIPVIFLHGGPGAGCEPYHRQLFDPEKYRIILFDQRGCGRSHPHASIENNTTQDLIADIEKIRNELNIDKWVVAGGSWGATLGVAYAETHPEKVSGLIVRGVFLCTQEEIDWLYQNGANHFFPDYWEDFLQPIPKSEQGDLLRAYHRRLIGANEIARMGAAKAWSLWEARIATLLPRSSVLEHFSDPKNALSIALLETHYFMNKGFIKEKQLLENASKLEGIPGYIIQGRYDMICPMKQAWNLHKAWTTSKIFIVQGVGHSASEAGISAAFVNASNNLLKFIKNAD